MTGEGNIIGTIRIADLRRAAMARRRLRANMERISDQVEGFASSTVGRGIGMSIAATTVATSTANKTRRMVREAPLLTLGAAIAAGLLAGSRRRRYLAMPRSLRASMPPMPTPHSPPSSPSGTGHQGAFSPPNALWTGLASVGIQLLLDTLSRRFDETT
jgi:hypothetical protein